jgi:chromosomal replication initiation ATPase DnaA
MDYLKWISNNLKKFDNHKLSFKDMVDRILRHDKLKLISINEFEAEFGINDIKYSTFSIKNKNKPIDAVHILQRVSAISNISIDALKGKSRKRENSDARFVFFLLCLENKSKLNLTTNQIGSMVNRHHSTVIHALNVQECKEINQLFIQVKRSL